MRYHYEKNICLFCIGNASSLLARMIMALNDENPAIYLPLCSLLSAPPLKKMIAFAIDGITSFSVKPIRYITTIGFLMFFVSVALLIYSVVRWIIGASVLGWASLICSVWAIGGLIMLSLGVIGEYIGKMYIEVKGRPSFILETVLDDEDN